MFLALLAGLCFASQGTALAQDNADESTDTETAVDYTKMKVKSIGEITTTIKEGSLYLIKQERNGVSPAYDTGEGIQLKRASSDDVIEAGVLGSDVDLAAYLLTFEASGSTSEKKPASGVYYLRWADGRYWQAASNSQAAAVSSVTGVDNATEFNVYTITEDETETSYIAVNYFDMGRSLNNDGAGKTVNIYADGEVTTTSNNDHWELYEVTLEDMTEEELEAAEQKALLSNLYNTLQEAQAAYDANSNLTYSEDDKLITVSTQFSSPYTEAKEGSFDNLLDGDASTYWHSDWSDGVVDDDIHYFRVDLDEAFDEATELIAYIARRSDAADDHITKMAVKTVPDAAQQEAAGEIADNDNMQILAILEYPFTSASDQLYAHFTCPAGVKSLYFYNEETSGSGEAGERGYFHLAEFQLYPAEMGEYSLNKYNSDVANALVSAITTASKAMEAGEYDSETLATLQEALQTYKDNITIVHQCEADLDEWSSDPEIGDSFQRNTWSTEADASGMVTPFVQYWVSGTTLEDETLSHSTIEGLPAGIYQVSLDARIFSESLVFAINEGTTYNVNDASVDFAETGTMGTYNDTETELYGTYSLLCEVEDGGTIDVSLALTNENFNWIAFKNLKVEYLSELPELPEATNTEDAQLNADVAQAQTDAIAAYEAEEGQTVANYNAAVAAIGAARNSIEYYQLISDYVTPHTESLDEAGQAKLAEITTALSEGTLTRSYDPADDVAAAYLAQTTSGVDMTYAIVYGGEWVGQTGTYGDAVERYDNQNFPASEKVLYKTLEGLHAGYYELNFYATSCNAWVGSTYGDNIAQVFATNCDPVDITVLDATAVTPSDHPYSFVLYLGEETAADENGTEVTREEGDEATPEAAATYTLEFGIQNTAAGGNWATCQAVSLTYIDDDLSSIIEDYKAALEEATAMTTNIKLDEDGQKEVSAVVTANTFTDDAVEAMSADELYAAIKALQEATAAGQATIDAMLEDYYEALAAAKEVQEGEQVPTTSATALAETITANDFTGEGVMDEKTASDVTTATAALVQAVADVEEAFAALVAQYQEDYSAAEEMKETIATALEGHGYAATDTMTEEDIKTEYEGLVTALTTALTTYSYETPSEESAATLEAAIDALEAVVLEAKGAIATALEGVETETEETPATIYTLSGTRVSKVSQPGIYIVNGKKVMVK